MYANSVHIYLIIIEVIFLCLHHTMIISKVSELSFRATALNLCVDNCYIFSNTQKHHKQEFLTSV